MLATVTTPAVVPAVEPGTVTVTGRAPTRTTVDDPGSEKPVTVATPWPEDGAEPPRTLITTGPVCADALVKVLVLASGALTVRLSGTSLYTPSERATTTVIGGTAPENPAEGANV